MWPFSSRVDRRRDDVEVQLLDLLEAHVVRYAERETDDPKNLSLSTMLRMEGETPQQRAEVVKFIRKHSKTNTHVRGILRTYVKYIARAGFTFNIKDAEVQTRFNRWAEFNNWPGRQKLAIKRSIRDGEAFIWWQEQDGMLYPRFLDPIKINNNRVSQAQGFTDGVQASEYDTERPAFFLHQDHGPIPADEVTWYRTDDEIGCMRAWPWFSLIAVNSRSYRAWLDDRIKLNRLRTAVAMIRKHPRKSKAQVDSWLASRKNTLSQGSDERDDTVDVGQERWRGAQVFDLHGEEDIDFKRPDVDARDARYDGRALLLTLAASTGLAEYMVTGDAANNAYASALVSEGPAVVEFESFQAYWSWMFKQDCLRVIEWLARTGWQGDENLDMVEVSGPRIVSREVLDVTRANEILFDNEVISRDGWRRREGEDPQQVQQEIEAEREGELGVGDGDVHGPADSGDGNVKPPESEEEGNGGEPSASPAATD